MDMKVNALMAPAPIESQTSVSQSDGTFKFCRQNLVDGHINHGSGLNGYHLIIRFQMDGVPGPHFIFRKNTVAQYQIDVLLLNIGRQAFGSGGIIAQTTGHSFLFPRIGIAVAVKEDPLMSGKGFPHQLMECFIKILCLLQPVRKFAQFLCHDGIQGNIRLSNGL